MTSTTDPTTHTVDRSGWPPGPWDHEPDYLSWTDETTGLPCLIVRNGGPLCGYVAVEPGHPWHGIGYGGRLPTCTHDDGDWCHEHTPDAAVTVHGGLTYSGECQSHICHVPEPGKPDNVWWFGFDCAHYLDASPAPHAYNGPGCVYRDVDYVRAEVTSLAAQLKAVSA